MRPWSVTVSSPSFLPRIVIAALSLSLAGCMGEIGDPHEDHHGDDEELSITITNQRVRDLESSTCSTASVAPLSRQIAEEMLCIAPNVLVRLDAGNGISFRSAAVLPYMEADAAEDLEAVARTQPVVLNSGFRTVVQQYLLHAWRQRGRCGIRAAATPGRSNHETGRAIDVGNRAAARSALRARGWRDPLPNDPVHFEHLSSPDMRGLDINAFQRLWNRNHPNDRIDEDGDYGAATAARIRMAPAAGFPMGASCSGGGVITTPESPNWFGDSCDDDTGCELPSSEGRCEAWFDADSGSMQGMCVSSCSGFCPDRSGEMPTFCAQVSPNEGLCVPRAGSENAQCDSLPGTEATTVRRFEGNNMTSASVATVCLPPQSEGIECSSDGAIGECIDTNITSCNGELASNACPGGNSIRCCVP